MKKKRRPWGLQTELQRQDIPTKEEVMEKIKATKYLMWKALFALVYLTGARIGEILKVTTPEDFKMIERDGKKILLVTLYNEKNRKRKIKKIPIYPITENERILTNYIIEFVNTFGEKEKPLWNISHQRAYKIFLKYLNMNPHFLRHLRLTHLVTDFNFNEHELKMFAGWSDTRPASAYIELRWTDILKKFENGNR